MREAARYAVAQGLAPRHWPLVRRCAAAIVRERRYRARRPKGSAARRQPAARSTAYDIAAASELPDGTQVTVLAAAHLLVTPMES